MWSRDPEELALLELVRQEAWKVLTEIHQSLAQRIVKEYSEAQKRGSSKKKS